MLPSQDCGISEVVCCTSLYDIAEHILAGVYEALLACYEPTTCTPGLLAYVTMGSGDDLVLDALSVAMAGIRPSNNSQSAGTVSPTGLYLATYAVRLIESGWPMAFEEGGEIFPPDPVLQNKLARHSYAHGERMYRRLAYMASHGDLTPNTVACTKATLSPLTPLPPAGGSVGWMATVELQLPGWP